MLSSVWPLLVLLSIISCCVADSDFGIQSGELLPSLDAEPNTFLLNSESPTGTDIKESSELTLAQSNDQCRYNTNQKPRKMRFKRGDACSPSHVPVRDNGWSGTGEPSSLPSIVPLAGEVPVTVDAVQQPHPDDNICPPAARYPVCADPVTFPITPDALFHHDLSRMQLKYCRACK